MKQESRHLGLNRRTHESIVFIITDENGKTTEFTQTVTRIKGKQVGLAFEAPNNVKIVRAEILAD